MNKLVKLIFLALVVAGCQPGGTDSRGVVIARVHDDYLYESDIRRLVPENLSRLDSIAFVRNYTDQWIKTRLMIRQAEKNLTDRQLNFDRQLEDYKNSLIHHAAFSTRPLLPVSQAAIRDCPTILRSTWTR